MTDSLLDDVNALLDKDFGDDIILKQICRACENDEVISNYERNYVRKLAEKHLGRRPEVVPTQIPVEEKPIIPDVVIPEIPPVQKIQTFQTVRQHGDYMTLPAWIIMTLIGINVANSIMNHGKSSGVIDGFRSTIDASITVGLLYWAGLFNG